MTREPGDAELFEPLGDREETNDLLTSRLESAKPLQETLRQWLDDTPAASAGRENDQENLERLRSLGYMR